MLHVPLPLKLALPLVVARADYKTDLFDCLPDAVLLSHVPQPQTG